MYAKVVTARIIIPAYIVGVSSKITPNIGIDASIIHKSFDNQKTKNMSDKKQTALQWYIQQHDELAELSRNKTITISEILIRIKDIKKQALEMEREQIISTFRDAQIFEVREYAITDVQYYNETYGGNNE